jgi:hypothetical protein
MQPKDEPKETTEQAAARTGEDPAERTKQQQTDPNLTELKGLTDPDEKLEPTDTDNDV